MELKKICRVTVLICLEGPSIEPVAHAVVDTFDVIENDGACAYFMIDGKRAGVSLRYKLYPLEPEHQRPMEIEGGTGAQLNSKEWMKRGFERVVLIASQYCRPEWVEQMTLAIAAECSKALRAGAAFRLTCIDALDQIS